MIVPNKVISFNSSVVSKLSRILDLLASKSFSVVGLYDELHEQFDNIDHFLVTLDALYALRRVEIDSKTGIITYVKTN